MMPLAWHGFEITINFVEIIGALYFTWRWISRETTTRFGSVSSILFMCIGTIWLSLYGFFDIAIVPDITPLIACVFLYALLILKIQWDIAITCAMLNTIILGTLAYSIDNLFSTALLVPYGSIVAQDTPRFATMILSHILWVLVWLGIIRWFHPFSSSTFITKGRWLIAMVPLFTLVLITVLLEYARAVPAAVNNISPFTGVCIGIGMLILNIGTLHLYSEMTKQAQEAILLQAQKQIGDMALQYKTELEALTQEARRFRHDFNNHIYTLQGLAEAKNYVSLNAYLSEIGGELWNFSKQISTGNQALDVLLNGNMNLAKQKKIHVTAEGNVPEQLPINDQHLCILIGNLFTNAFEACEKITEIEKRSICIQVYTQRNHLFISMENSTDGSEQKLDGKWITTKQNPQEHGFGLLSIDLLVKQYHGYCDRSHQNHRFSTTIVFPLAELE